MARKDKASLARQDLVDKIRTQLRLEHRMEMRRQLNEVESDALEEFERRLSAGEAIELDASYDDWVTRAALKAKEDADD